MTDKLDTSKLVPLDVTGLEPIDDQSKPLNVSGLEPLDVSGLEPMDAPPVQPVAVVEPTPVATAFTPAASSSSQFYAPVIPQTQQPVEKTIWNRNDGVFHKTIKPGEPIGIVYQGKKMMAVYDATTGKFKTEIDDQTKPIKGNYLPPPGYAAPFPAPVTPDTFGKVELDPSQIEAFAEGRGALRSIRNTALRALPSTASSFAAFNAAGIPAAAWAGRAHPYLAPVGFVVGGGLGAMGAGAATDMAVNAMFPMDENDELNQILYPTQNELTQQGVAVAALRPSANTLLGIAALEKAALAQAGKGAALNTALAGQHRLVEEITSDKPFSLGNVFAPGEMAKDAAHGAFLMHKATAMGRAFEHPGKVLGAKLSPAPRPQDATASTQELRTADQPLDTSGLEPVATEGKPPSPPQPAAAERPEGAVESRPIYDERFKGKGQAGIDEFTKAWQEWDAKYKDTHWSDGTPRKSAPVADSAATEGNVPPRPVWRIADGQTMEQTMEFVKRAEDWDKQYGDKYNADGTLKQKKPDSSQQTAPATPANVEPRPKTPAHNAPKSEWDAYWPVSKEWDAKHRKTHWNDGSPRPAKWIEGTTEYAAREAEVAEREKKKNDAAASENVPPRPRFNKETDGVSLEAIEAFEKKAKEWDDQHKATHWEDGRPKQTSIPKPAKPVAPAEAAQDAQVETKPDQPKPAAKPSDPYTWTQKEGQEKWVNNDNTGFIMKSGGFFEIFRRLENNALEKVGNAKDFQGAKDWFVNRQIADKRIPNTQQKPPESAKPPASPEPAKSEPSDPVAPETDEYSRNTVRMAQRLAAGEFNPTNEEHVVALVRYNKSGEHNSYVRIFKDRIERYVSEKPWITENIKLKEFKQLLSGKKVNVENGNFTYEPVSKEITSEPVIPEAQESPPEVQLAHLREQRDRLAATQPEPGTTQEAQLKKLEEAVDDLEEKLKEPNSQVGLVRNEGFTPGEVEALRALGLDSMKKRLAEMEASGRGESMDAKKLRDVIAAREKRSSEAGKEPVEPTQKDATEEPKDKAPAVETPVEAAPVDAKSYEDQQNVVKGLERQLAAIEKRKPDRYTEKQKQKIQDTLARERAKLDAMPVPAEGDKPKKERVPRKVSYDDASLRRINGRWFTIDVKNGGSKNLSLNQIKESMPHLYDKAVKMNAEAEAEGAAEFKRIDADIRRFAAEAKKIADSDMTTEQKRDALAELDKRVTEADFNVPAERNAVFVGIDNELLTKVENSPRPADIREAPERDFPVDDPANGWQEGTGEATKLRLNIRVEPDGNAALMGIAIHMGEAKDAFKEGRAADALEMAKQGKGLAETLEGYARRRAKAIIDSFEQETGINIGKSIEAEETHPKTGEPIKGVPFPDSGPATEGLVNSQKDKGTKKKIQKNSAEDLRQRIDDLQERADELDENDPDGAEELRIKASKLQEKLDAMETAEPQEQQATKPDKSGKEAPVNEENGFETEIGGIKFRSRNVKMLDSEEEATRYTFVKKTSPGKGALIGIDIGTDHLTGKMSVEMISDTGKRNPDGTVLKAIQTADIVIPEGIKTVDQLLNLLKKGTLTEFGPDWNNPKKPGKDAKAIKKLLDSVSGEGEAGQGAKPKPKVTPPDAGQGKGPKDAPFDYDKVLKIFNIVSDIGDYKSMGGTEAKAAGRIENVIKQLEKIFPDIREASLYDENLKSMPMPYDTTTRAEAEAEPDIRAKTISRYLSRKMEPYRDKANVKDQPAEEPVDLAEEDVPPGQEKGITETKKQIARYESIKNKEAWHKEELNRLKEVLADQEAASSAYNGEERVRSGLDKLGKLYNKAADAYNNSKPRESVEAELTAQIHALRDMGVSEKNISNWLYHGHESKNGVPAPGVIGDAFASYKDPYPDVKRRTFDEAFTRHQTPGNTKRDNSYSEWEDGNQRRMLSQLIWWGKRKRDSRGKWHGGWGLQIFRTPGEPGYKSLDFGFDTKEELMAEYDKLLRMHSFKYRSEKTAISHTEELIVPKLSGFDPAEIEAANKRTNTLKDIEKHPLVESISDERDRDGNGIWVYLKDGFVNDATNTGAIHEDTVPGVLKLLKRASFDIRDTESDKFEAGRKAAKEAKAQSQAEANKAALRAMEAAEAPKTEPVQEAAQEPAEKKYPIEKLEDALAEKGLKVLRRNNTDDFVAEGGVEENGRQRPTLVVGDTKITLASEGMELVNGKVQIMDGQEKDAAGNVIYSIERIVTAPEGRGKGSASKALDELTEAADKAGLTLQLEPTPFRSIIGKGESLNKQQLIEWYKKNGFEQKTEGSDAILIRKPKTGQATVGRTEPASGTQYGDEVGRKKVKELEKLNDRIDEIDLFEAPEPGGSRGEPEGLTEARRAELMKEVADLRENRAVLEKDISENHKDLWGKKNADVLEYVRRRIKEHNDKFEPTLEWIQSHPAFESLSTAITGRKYNPKNKAQLSLRDGLEFDYSRDTEYNSTPYEYFEPGTSIREIAETLRDKVRIDPYSNPNNGLTGGSMLRQRIAEVRKEMKSGEGTTLDMRRDPNNDANDAFDMEERKAKELDRRVKQNAENREAGKDFDGGRRGFIGIMDRAVSEARMRGEITDKEVEGLSRIINYVGSQFFGGVKMSIRQGRPGYQGQYDVANRVVTIFKEAIQRGRFEDTAAHEIGHHLEQFLPEGDRAALRAEWLAARKKFTDKWSTFGRLVGNAENWGRVKVSPEAYDAAIADMPTLSRFFTPEYTDKGKIKHYRVKPTEEMYRLFSAKEWFAETFKDAAREKLESDPAYTGEQAGWKQKVVGLWNNIKTAFNQMFGREQAKRILANFAKGRYKPEDGDPSIYSEGDEMFSKREKSEAEQEARLTPEERDLIDKERQDARDQARGEKPELSAGGKVWRSAIDSPFVSWFKPISMRMRTIGDLNPQSESLQKLVNDFSLIPGKEAAGPDFNTDVANVRNVFYNKLTRAFGPVLEDMHKMSPTERAEFNDLFVRAMEGRLPRKLTGEVGAAIERVRAIMEEMHKYGIDAGLKMGKVEGYFPRSADANLVEADQIGFIRAATRAYEKQFERLQAEAEKEALENGTEYVRPETPDFDQKARDWRNAILLGHEGLDFEHGLFDPRHEATKESFQKGREFTKEEAMEFDAFRDKDVERIVSNYVGSIVRRAELVRRIGSSNKSWQNIKMRMDKQGVSVEDINTMEELVKSNIGINGKRIGESTQQALDFGKLVSNAAYLKLTGLLNYAEAASIGIRTESPLEGARAVLEMFQRSGNMLTRLTPEQTKEAKNEIEAIYGKGHDLASALAIEFGINTIDRGFGTVASGYHLDGGSDFQGKLNKASDGVYRMYGIHATEAAKREVSLRAGATFIDTTIKWLEGTHNLQRLGKKMGKDIRAENMAKQRLKELGITEADMPDFITWVKKMRAGNESSQLRDIMSKDPMAQKYSKALILFNKQASVQASRASRSEAANDTPIGKLFFQFTTFTNEWSAQHGRRMVEQSKKIVGDKKYNAAEKMLMAGIAPSFALATAATMGIRWVINKITGFQYEDGDKIPAWVKSLADAVVYTGILGPAESVWKLVSRGQLPAGVIGDWVKKSVQTIQALAENPESRPVQRNAVSMTYRSALVPAAAAGLATASEAAPLPLKLVGAAAAQAIANNRTEKSIADLVAGEEIERGSTQMPKPPNPPKPRPPGPR